MNDSNELFLLMFNLVQVEDILLLKRLFIEALNSSFDNLNFSYKEEKISPDAEYIEVATRGNLYGFIEIKNSLKSTDDKVQTLIRNSIQLFSIILENRYQTILLEDKKLDLEKSLKIYEKRFQIIFENAPVGIALISTNGLWLQVNSKICDITGFTKDELLGRHISGISHPDDIDAISKQINSLLKGFSQTVYTIKRYIHKKGNIIWINMVISLVKDMSDNPLYFVAAIEDITSRKIAQESIKESELRYRSIVQNAPVIIIHLSSEGKIIELNPEAGKLFGVYTDDVINKNYFNLFVNIDEQEDFHRELQNALTGNPVKNFESQIQFKDGCRRYLTWNFDIIPASNTVGSGIIAIGLDITDRKIYEERINASLKEKEILLKEIHHRVKNNMQIISSFLNLQSYYLDNSEIINILQETRNRVSTMALLHEQLYQSKDLGCILVPDYLNSLLGNLLSSYNLRREDIDLEIKCADLALDMDYLIPSGLIINELVTNSIKHAFRNTVNPALKVEFRLDNPGKYSIIVSDNGCGLPEKIDIKNTGTLGLQIVDSLIQQLKAIMEINISKGTEICISFKAEK